MFMQPQAIHMQAWHVETMVGGEIVPADLVGMFPTAASLRDYLEGEPLTDDEGNPEMTLETGWYSRFSAPGYMDRTDWSGPEVSEDAALDSLAESFDCCRQCWGQCWDDDNGCPEEAEGE